MRKKIAVAVLLVLTGYVLHAQTTPRFERLNSESHGEYVRFSVWHDREAGEEFVCVHSGVDLGLSVSCFPTGRNWK